VRINARRRIIKTQYFILLLRGQAEEAQCSSYHDIIRKEIKAKYPKSRKGNTTLAATPFLKNKVLQTGNEEVALKDFVSKDRYGGACL
jgi:hypothetical protein